MVTLAEVSSIRLERARINHEAYKTLYAQCSRVIMNSAKRYDQSATFLVTPWVHGHPLIDTRRASRYICDKLKRGGFQVQAEERFPFVQLFVSWNASSDSFIKSIKQRMVPAPAAEATEPKEEDDKDKDLLDDIMAIIAKK